VRLLIARPHRAAANWYAASTGAIAKRRLVRFVQLKNNYQRQYRLLRSGRERRLVTAARRSCHKISDIYFEVRSNSLRRAESMRVPSEAKWKSKLLQRITAKIFYGFLFPLSPVAEEILELKSAMTCE
jgi:hypothetical protein